jgi:hypothetical protein
MLFLLCKKVAKLSHHFLAPPGKIKQHCFVGGEAIFEEIYA